MNYGPIRHHFVGEVVVTTKVAAANSISFKTSFYGGLTAGTRGSSV